MSAVSQYLDDWSPDDLVDPRGKKFVPDEAEASTKVNAWPTKRLPRKVGLFSNKKPNADAMLEQVKQCLLEVAPNLSFDYGSKEPLAEDADPAVIQRLSTCDVVVLASAECGGCTSWLCRDQISLEKLGVPCLLIATHRFESLARTVLSRGGIENPHLLVPKHPVSGIPADEAKNKIRELASRILTEVLGAESTGTAGVKQTV